MAWPGLVYTVFPLEPGRQATCARPRRQSRPVLLLAGDQCASGLDAGGSGGSATTTAAAPGGTPGRHRALRRLVRLPAGAAASGTRDGMPGPSLLRWLAASAVVVGTSWCGFLTASTWFRWSHCAGRCCSPPGAAVSLAVVLLEQFFRNVGRFPLEHQAAVLGLAGAFLFDIYLLLPGRAVQPARRRRLQHPRWGPCAGGAVPVAAVHRAAAATGCRKHPDLAQGCLPFGDAGSIGGTCCSSRAWAITSASSAATGAGRCSWYVRLGLVG